MKLRPDSLLIALLVSLVAHAILFMSLKSELIEGLLFRRSTAIAQEGKAPEQPKVVSEQQPPQPAPPELLDLFDQLGEFEGTGAAIKASPGDLDALLRAGFQDQPLLSADPEGQNGQPAEASVEVISARRSPAQRSMGLPQKVFIPLPRKMQTRAAPKPADQSDYEPRGIDADGTTPEPDAPASRATASVSHEQPQALAYQPPPASRTMAVSRAPGDPAPEGDSTIDGFRKSEAVEAVIRSGRLDPQSGRSFKFHAPRLGDAAPFEMLSKKRDTLVLKISIDREGNVVAVDVPQSCGSEYIDHAFTLAAYKSWFEPHPERAGKSGETFEFTIRFV